ncbi:DinB family protein [Niabella drilacis]|uniref:DinB superfamily protein n=1 Tax=Niabella drilacis (strain DSM 25811 / CCM 8410 / CCUG 62505 / LMG 26954 / E90) TaxID=1285928 RepID=A0A1G6NLI6_NIADE|nr:DinB family protein [Niabella drilacis]SDC68045.1 DinB superfamily protein [Niabella drilacis]
MKRTELIAQHLIEVHEGNNWTSVAIADTISDIGWSEAFAPVPFSPNTIALLLGHIAYWNRIVAERGRGITPVIAGHNGFEVPEAGTGSWEKLKEVLFRSARELAEVIRQFDEAKLEMPVLPEHSSAYKNFQGQVEHAHYHLGQIVMIKKYLRSAG